MKKYRVTELGFIGRLVRPGDIIDVDGEPPIGGLVLIEDKPAAPAAAEPAPEQAKPAARASRSRSQTPPAAAGDGAEVI
jgi:hypothetical protein